MTPELKNKFFFPKRDIVKITCEKCGQFTNEDPPEILCKHLKHYIGFAGFLKFLLEGVSHLIFAAAAGFLVSIVILFFAGSMFSLVWKQPPMLEKAADTFCAGYNSNTK